MFQLVAFDLDGTLLNDHKQLTEEVIYSVRRVKEMGVTIVLSSGRSYVGMKPYLSRLGENTVDYAICFNGAQIVDEQQKKELYSTRFSVAECERILKESFLSELALHFVASDRVVTANNPIGIYTIHEAFLTNVPIEYCVPERIARSDHYFKALFSAGAEELTAKSIGFSTNFKKSFTLAKSGGPYLEVLQKGISKGTSLKRLLSFLAIDLRNVAAFGDQENDISMILPVGLGIAMKNAPDFVKEQADYITDSNNNDGVSKALKLFLL